MKIALCGNFTTTANTEVHLVAALREWGEQVTELQLSKATVKSLPAYLRTHPTDILLWVHTSYLCRDNALIAKAITSAKKQGVLTAAFHLDRYWDLQRETSIREESWFQCLPGSTRVIAANVRKVIRRWYSGNLCTVFASEHELSATPNHPILTNRGWIALGEVQEGDYLISYVGDDRTSVSGPDIENPPPTIEEIFQSCAKTELSLAGVSQRTRTTPMDFHGDGSLGEVDVVRTARNLSFPLCSISSENLEKLQFVLGEAGKVHIPHPGTEHFAMLKTPNSYLFSSVPQVNTFFSEDSFVPFGCTSPLIDEINDGGSFQVPFDNFYPEFFSNFSTPSQSVLRPRSDLSSSTMEKSMNQSLGPIDGICDFLHSCSRLISLTEVTKVVVAPFEGHVYNLQTEEGAYLAEGIVTHNCDVVFTADGGNQQRFKDAGINHIWMPPAVHGPDAELVGVPRDEYKCKVAFVGSWQSYHPEWPWRLEMIELLRRYYKDDFRTFPITRQQPIRGQDLSDLYASVDVVVGDSIFAGDKRGGGYVSDRIFLTLGHGGCLVHPRNSPLEDSFKDGVHLRYFNAGEPRTMFAVIDELLSDPDQRATLKENGHAEVLNNHLYRHRAREMVQLMTQQRLSILGWPGEVREGTHDATAIRETWLDDVYHAKDIFHLGDLVLDCGANVGAFTIFAALQGADVIAVEPVPNNLKQLRQNIMLAGVQDRVTIIESAVGEKIGTIKLDFFDVDKSQSAYRHNDGEEGGEIEVPVTTIANILQGRKVKFLKMDIEGSERWALPDAPLHLAERIAIETHNTLDPGTTHERVKEWVGRTHDIVVDTGGHSEGYVIATRR